MKRSQASERLRRAVQIVVEQLEDRRLLSGDPLAYQNVVQTLPFSLNFTQQVNGVFDQAGQSIGFTRVQVNSQGNQYQPNLLNLNTSAGELDITTTGTATAGSAYGTDNSQVNALETQFAGTTSGFTITTRLKGPLNNLSTTWDGAGVYFGPDQDNYVKLIAEYDSTRGQTLQFTDEQNATTHTVNNYANIGSFANVTTLDLRLTGDAGTGKVTASYSLNGGTFVTMPGAMQLSGTEEAAFFNSASRAGIYAANKNNLPGITVPFTHFEIDPGTQVVQHPSIINVNPGNYTMGVLLDTSVAADLNLPNGALDPSTVNTANVQLYRTSDHSMVSAVVNTSGGADSVVLTPTANLAANTQYTFSIGAGVKDVTGVSLTPFTSTFTTGTTTANADPSLQFQQVDLPTASGVAFSSVEIGPDHKLYAGTEDGQIYRYTINADGTLGSPQIITSLQQYEGGNRLLTGFAFDPASTASNPILWVSNSYYGFTNVPDWTGKITVMSGSDLQTVQDAVVNLPRSFQDHTTEQPTFGPDGALYFAQGGNTAMGAPDSTWGNRAEDQLSAAILRLDTSKLNLSQGPLDVKTADGGGTYDPFAAGAPLTLYATGVRNAYSLVWTTDGHLYAPTNGSSAGGNTPAFPNSVNGDRIDTGQPYNGPAVPALTNVPQSEIDWLFNVQQGGYYGHPDPARGEFVLDAGNPSGSTDPNIVPEYPVGTQPDPNYRGYAYNFGDHYSPDGILEYQDKTFGGKMQGMLLVTEYSAGNDIIALTPDANGNITSAQRGIAGFTDLNNPLGIVEDTSNGNLYVTELGGMKIELLRPTTATAAATVSQSLMAFNAIDTGVSGSGPSPAQSVTLTNTGNVTINLKSGGLTIVNDPAVSTQDASDFTISNLASLPTSLMPGQSVTLNITFTAPSSGLHSAILQVLNSASSQPLAQVTLRGLGTTGTGGANEPSLAAILREYEIPTIVGDGPNDANAFASTFYPNPPDASSQEVVMQRLQKAGSGPVTIQLLGAFDVSNQPAARFGYYSPGDPTNRTELFTINQSDAQTVNPTARGATSFDPGSSEFGLYANFPTFTDNGHQRLSYSEDSLNTWDTNVPRKIRFFPLENPDGSVVPNAYVFAAEDNNKFFSPNIQPYDSNDIVGIIRNVQAAPGAPNGAVLGLTSLDGVPSNNRLVFNRIQNKNPADPSTFTDVVHDTDTLQINNTGNQTLVISGLSLSDSTNWQIVNPPTLPLSIAPGGSTNITVKFIATTDPPHSNNQTNDTQTANGISVTAAGGVWNGTLTITSNDAARPTRSVQLAGYWQYMSENENEPSLQTIINGLYGYGTSISATQQPEYPNNGSAPVYYGEEVASGLWNVADPTLPVSVRQLDAFHNQFDPTTGTQPASIIGWYAQGSSTTNWLFRDQTGEAQSLLPTISGSNTTPAAGSFTPSGTFGWNLDGENSQDSLNTTDINTWGRSGHAVRFYPARDSQGNLIANTWLAVMDYENSQFDNSDYQDNVYLVTNMRPANAAPTPQDAQATAGATGILLQWQPVVDSTLTGYNVYRGTSPTGTFTKINSSPITTASYLDSAAPGGVTSYYRVTAVDSKGESVGANASAMAVGSSVAPGTPGTLTRTVNSNGSVALSWSASSGTVTAYHVERSSNGVNFTELAGNVQTTSYTDTTAQPGATYTYRVRAEDAGAYSAYSTASPVTLAPAAPTGLAVTATTSSSVSLGWSASNGATGYLVLRKGPSDSSFVQAGSVTGTSYTDGTVQSNSTYSYEVVAANSAGNSPASAAVSAAVPQTSSTVTLGASADTYVRDGSAASTNFGSASDLQAKSTDPGYNREIFLKFDASSISGSIGSVVLRLYGDLQTGTTPYTLSVVAVPNTWAENTLTWNTKPADGSSLASATISSTSPQWYSWDLTSYVQAQLAAGNSTIALAIRGAAYTSGPYTDFASRESGANGPQLVVTTTSQGPTAPAAPTNLTVTGTTASSVALSWSASTGTVTAYHVERSSDGTHFTELAGNVQTTSYTDTTAQAGATYTYRVRAENAGAFSGYSNTQQATLAPAAPAGLSVTATTSSSASLAWSASNGATGYLVLRKGPSDSSFVQVGSTSSTTYTDSGLSASTAYAYEVVAQNAAGPSSPAGPVNATTAQASSAVTLSASADTYARDGSSASTNFGSASDLQAKSTDPGYNREIFLKFDASSISGSVSSVVLRLYGNLQTGNTAYPLNAVSVANTSWAENTLTWNNKPADGSVLATTSITTSSPQWYSWDVTNYVKAQLAAGNTTIALAIRGAVYTSGAYTDFASRETGGNGPQLVVTATQATAPSVPTNLTAQAGSGQVLLSWSASSGTVTAYHVERSSDGTHFTELAGNVQTTSYTDTTAQAGATYTYRVRAENAGTFSAYATAAPLTLAPAAPTNLAVTGTTSSSVSLSWSAPAGANGYLVLRKGPSDSSFMQVGTTTSVAYTDSSLSASTTYAYEVVAQNAGGQSPAAGPVSATTAAASSTVTLSASADTYVRDGSAASTNFGSASDLQAKSTDPGYNREIFLKFDASSINGSINSVVLRLYGDLQTGNTPSGLSAVSTDGSWAENTLTWNNKPADGSVLATTTIGSTSPQWYSWDLTSYVKAQLAAGNTTIALAIRGAAYTSGPYTDFASRESGTNGPQLVVTTM